MMVALCQKMFFRESKTRAGKESKRKKCTSGVGKESIDPIKIQTKREGVAGVVNVLKITPEPVPEKRRRT